MKKFKLIPFLLIEILLITLLPFQVFASNTGTITVVLLGNHGTATVSKGYSESQGLIWQQELVGGNKVGTDVIAHINQGPFNDLNLKAGYLVTANDGYYIDAFYRCQADYDNKYSSLENLNPTESQFQYDHRGYLISGILTEMTWPEETFYISFKEIPEETSTLSLVIVGNNGIVTNKVGDYTTSKGILWQQELSLGNRLGTDTLVLEHKAPWGEAVDGMKAGYEISAKEGYYIKSLYPNKEAFDAKQPVDSEAYSNVLKNADGYTTSCQWVWYAKPEATAYFEFEKIPDSAITKNDTFKGTTLELKTTNDPKKQWTVKFNILVDKGTVTPANIYITDESGTVIQIKELEVLEDRRSIVIIPKEEYKQGKTYYMYIKKELQSASGKNMQKDIRIPFVYE